MAKRFYDSRKFQDPWYRKLDPKYKLFWDYLLCACNHAGIWKIDFELASFCIGLEIEEVESLSIFKDRIKPLDGEKWFIPKFVWFQYGELNENVNCHKSVIFELKRERVYQQLINSCLTVKDKDKDKDTDKDKRGALVEKVIAYWDAKMPNKIRKMSETRRNKLILRLQDQDFDYIAIIDKMAASDFLTGRKPSGDPKHSNWKADIEWLIANDTNYLKVLEGKYDNKKYSVEDEFDRNKKEK